MKFPKILKQGSFIVLAISCFSFCLKPTEERYVEVVFSHNLAISDLALIQNNLFKKEIFLNYDYLKFDKDGKLQAIKYSVKYKKVGGSDESEDMKRELGFIINTDSNLHPKYGIIVGFKDQIEKRRIQIENGEFPPKK